MLRRASGIKKLGFVNKNEELQNSLIFKILLDPELGKRFLNEKIDPKVGDFAQNFEY